MKFYTSIIFQSIMASVAFADEENLLRGSFDEHGKQRPSAVCHDDPLFFTNPTPNLGFENVSLDRWTISDGKCPDNGEARVDCFLGAPEGNCHSVIKGSKIITREFSVQPGASKVCSEDGITSCFSFYYAFRNEGDVNNDFMTVKVELNGVKIFSNKITSQDVGQFGFSDWILAQIPLTKLPARPKLKVTGRVENAVDCSNDSLAGFDGFQLTLGACPS
jgi:hypothetical protein